MATPNVIAQCFSSAPLTKDLLQTLDAAFPPDGSVEWIGPYAPAGGVTMGEPTFIKAMELAIASFPDLTFNKEGASFTKDASGVWKATCVTAGTHTGAGYSPKPDELPAMPASGKYCALVAAEYSIYFDGDKVSSPDLHFGSNSPPVSWQSLTEPRMPP
jgi:hypothetical protein